MQQKSTSVVAVAMFLAACGTTSGTGAAGGWGRRASVEAPSPEVMPAPAISAGAIPGDPAPSLVPAFVRGFDSPDDLLEPQGRPRPAGRQMWSPGRTMMTGYFGANLFDKIERTGGTGPTVDGAGEELSQMPTLGGGAQTKLGGDNIDLGLEALLGLSWRSNATAIAVGGGGAAVAVDVGVLLIDLYGGPFLNVFLGDKVRTYVGAGPMLQWADYDQSSSSLTNDASGSGFGVGYYARAGIEAAIGRGTLVGMVVRWSDTTIDLSGGQGDLDVEGIVVALTLSHWY